MNTTLLVIALVSITLAATLTVVVIRMILAERRRSVARVEALAAEIHQGPLASFASDDETELPADSDIFEDERELAVGSDTFHDETMPPIGTGLFHDETRPPVVSDLFHDETRPPVNGDLFHDETRPPVNSDMFDDETRPPFDSDVSDPDGEAARPAGFRLAALAVAAGIIVLIVVGLGTYRAWPDLQAVDETGGAVTSPSSPLPLELLALDHEQVEDHLTVLGIVRNPARGTEVDHLTAVVLLFNQQGAFLTSGRVAIDPAALEPGSEARFAITIPGATDVGRYRVSFRTDDRVVPHVDRRES